MSRAQLECFLQRRTMPSAPLTTPSLFLLSFSFLLPFLTPFVANDCVVSNWVVVSGCSEECGGGTMVPFPPSNAHSAPTHPNHRPSTEQYSSNPTAALLVQNSLCRV